jgi:hypothetical protein
MPDLTAVEVGKRKDGGDRFSSLFLAQLQFTLDAVGAKGSPVMTT